MKNPIYCRCTERMQTLGGITKSYTLVIIAQESADPHYLVLTPNELKESINRGELVVINMKLTSDNKLYLLDDFEDTELLSRKSLPMSEVAKHVGRVFPLMFEIINPSLPNGYKVIVHEAKGDRLYEIRLMKESSSGERTVEHYLAIFYRDYVVFRHTADAATGIEFSYEALKSLTKEWLEDHYDYLGSHLRDLIERRKTWDSINGKFS